MVWLEVLTESKNYENFMNCVFVHQNKKVYQDAICIFNSVQLDEWDYHQQNYGIRIKTFEHIKYMMT